MLVTLLVLFLYLAFIYLIVYHHILHPGAVYFPTKEVIILDILKNLKVKKGDLVVDLGSGDARILFGFAKKGIKSIGYEINPILAHKSIKRVQKSHLSKLITIYNDSMYNSDLSRATIITIYQFPTYMQKILNHIQKNIQKPVTLISNQYPFPTLKPYKVANKIYFYHLKPIIS